MWVCKACICVLIRVSVDTWIAHVVAIVNPAAVDVEMQLLVWVPAVSALGCIFRSGIVASHGNCIFKFLRNHHTCCPTTAVPFCVQAQYNKDASFSTSSPVLLFSLLIAAVLKGSRCWWRHLKSRNWSLFACECSVVSTSAIEKPSFFYCIAFESLSKNQMTVCVGLFLDSVLSLQKFWSNLLMWNALSLI